MPGGVSAFMIVDCSGWVNIVLEMLLMGNLTCPLFGLCMWK